MKLIKCNEIDSVDLNQAVPQYYSREGTHYTTITLHTPSLIRYEEHVLHVPEQRSLEGPVLTEVLVASHMVQWALY